MEYKRVKIMEHNWTVLEGIAAGMKSNNPKWRLGQCFVNALYKYDPVTADKIRGTDFDPFHIDERLPMFAAQVMKYWTETAE